MEKLIVKAKMLNYLVISGIIFTVLMATVIGVTVDSQLSKGLEIFCNLIYAFGGLLLFLCVIYVPITIMLTNWHNNELNSCKWPWGILAIFILPFLAPLIFTSKAKRILMLEMELNRIETIDKSHQENKSDQTEVQ